MKNHYKTLGLLHDVEEVVIKAAYKALAQKYHPDRHLSNKVENTAKMAVLNDLPAAASRSSVPRRGSIR